AALHFLDIRHGSPQHFPGKLQTELIVRLQKNTFRLSQPLPHRAVSRLAEIAALGVLRMRPAGKQGDLYVCDRRPCQHARMFFLLKMSEDQALPVPGKHVFAAGCEILASASRFSRFQQKIYLRVMPERSEEHTSELQSRFDLVCPL